MCGANFLNKTRQTMGEHKKQCHCLHSLVFTKKNPNRTSCSGPVTPSAAPHPEPLWGGLDGLPGQGASDGKLTGLHHRLCGGAVLQGVDHDLPRNGTE